MELQVGVKVFLKNAAGKYLLLHRSTKKYPEVKDGWDIVGGRIDPGIPLIENLQREIKEETDLVLLQPPRLIAAQDILKVKGRHVVRLTYIGEIHGEPKIDPEEHNEYRWLTKEELKRLTNLDSYAGELVEKNLI